MLSTPNVKADIDHNFYPVPQPPKIVVYSGAVQFTMQADGQIALYSNRGLFACECQGKRVYQLPGDARPILTMRYDTDRVALWRSETVVYGIRDEVLTEFKMRDELSPYADFRKVQKPDESEDDNAPVLCDYFHVEPYDDDKTGEDDHPLPTRLPVRED